MQRAVYPRHRGFVFPRVLSRHVASTGRCPGLDRIAAALAPLPAPTTSSESMPADGEELGSER